MKARFWLVLATLAVAIALMNISRSPFQAVAQQPVPPQPDPAFVDPVGLPPLAAPQPPPTQQLQQLIARLKDLRQQEKEVIEQIQKVIAAQKRTLQEAEDELRRLGVEGQRLFPRLDEKKDDTPPPPVRFDKDKK